MHIIMYIRTLNALLLPSTATATGPVLATAAWRLASLPLLMDTLPEILAPRSELSYVHWPCYTHTYRNNIIIIVIKTLMLWCTHPSIERVFVSSGYPFISQNVHVGIVHIAPLTSVVTIRNCRIVHTQESNRRVTTTMQFNITNVLHIISGLRPGFN